MGVAQEIKKDQSSFTLDEIRDIVDRLNISNEEKKEVVDKFTYKANEKKRETIYNENKTLIDDILDAQEKFNNGKINYFIGPIGFIIQQKPTKDDLIHKITNIKKIIDRATSCYDSNNEIIGALNHEFKDGKYMFPQYHTPTHSSNDVEYFKEQYQMMLGYAVIWNC
jgi:hypothetical protein